MHAGLRGASVQMIGADGLSLSTAPVGQRLHAGRLIPQRFDMAGGVAAQ